MRPFLLCASGASMSSAFHTLILPRGSEGVFPHQAKNTGMVTSQQPYTSAPLSAGTGEGGGFITISGGGASISCGKIPSQNKINGTYHNPVQVPQTEPGTNKPTSIEPSTRQSTPTATMSHTPLSSLTTPSAVELVATVAPDRNPAHPQNVVPNVQVGLDYAAPSNNGMHVLCSTKDSVPHSRC